MTNIAPMILVSAAILTGIFNYVGSPPYEALVLAMLIQIVFLLSIGVEALMKLNNNFYNKFVDKSGE